MILNINTNQIKPVLDRLIGVVPSKNNLAILCNFCFKAENNVLSIAATDLDLSISESIELEIIEEGEITIPAVKLYEIIKNYPANTDINLSINKSNNNVCKIKPIDKGLKLNYTVSCLPTTDYPEFANTDDVEFISIKESDLYNAINKTKVCTAKNDVRNFLGGIFTKKLEDKILFVSTDGKRLAHFEVENDDNTILFDCIIPNKTVNELIRVLKPNNSDNFIQFGKSENQLFFKINDNLLLISNIINSTFPDYEKVVPTTFINSVTLYTDKLIKATQQISLLSDKLTQKIKLNFSNLNNNFKLNMFAVSSDLGDAENELELNTCKLDQSSIESAFNYQYLIDSLNLIDTKHVEIRFNQSTSPFMLCNSFDDIENEITSRFFYIIMPMKMGEV